MQIDYAQEPTNQTVLRAVRGEYDGAPAVDALTVDFGPPAPNADRLGIAAYLAFGSHVSGVLELPVEVSPATGNAIRDDSGLAAVAPSPVRLRPQPLPIGSRSVRISIDSFDPIADSSLAILSSGSWNGRLRSHYSMAVGSNAFLLCRDAHDIRPYLAVAVLLAEDLDADELVLPAALAVGDTEALRLQRLLDVCRLGLIWTAPLSHEELSQR